MEILLNDCYGGFGVSEKALELYNERSGNDVTYISGYEGNFRVDPILIDIVKELGDAANDEYSELRIDHVPDGYGYKIEEYDGLETLHLIVTEEHLRKLIRLGNENDIVNYVMSAS